MQLPRTNTSRFGLGAGLAGGALALVLVTGLGPAPALSSISSNRQQDDSSTSTTAPTSTSSSTSSTATTATTARPALGTRVVDAGGAGTVTVSDDGAQLSVVSAVPSMGWSVEVERSAGREVEVDFRRGTQRVQVNVELEDGAVRERVRFRDDA